MLDSRIVIKIKDIVIGPRYTFPVITKKKWWKIGKTNMIGTIAKSRFT